MFLGRWTPESVGDYASGTNHVLPTYGYARMYSGVSLDSFQKKMTVQVGAARWAGGGTVPGAWRGAGERMASVRTGEGEGGMSKGVEWYTVHVRVGHTVGQCEGAGGLPDERGRGRQAGRKSRKGSARRGRTCTAFLCTKGASPRGLYVVVLYGSC